MKKNNKLILRRLVAGVLDSSLSFILCIVPAMYMAYFVHLDLFKQLEGLYEHNASTGGVKIQLAAMLDFLNEYAFQVTVTGVSCLFFLVATYFIIFEISKFQASIGKKIAKIYIISDDTSKPSMSKLALRFILFSVFSGSITSKDYLVAVGRVEFSYNVHSDAIFWSIISISFITFIPIIITKGEKGLHDFICKTRIVYGRPY